ncbi:hypothetical protein L1987_54647 [Smallanthus sonchifolius]|uniref:Uncharacterized protein n=1 Tax=Smallanthus sonchifolius TaxID=185202 RepID=A0ACB9E836_9ASTR|nr:hypothetical protein L1987_54647 [Smallanthus sonchifolius]
MQHQLLDYGLTFLNTPIFCDNEAAVLIVKNSVQHSKTKHIDIKVHFIRDYFERNLICLERVDSDNNVLDIFTKAFDTSRFHGSLVKAYMAEMKFVADHNVCAFTMDPPEEFDYFRSVVVGLTLSPINFVVMENPIIYRSHIQEFWSSAMIHPNDNGEECIIGTVQAKRVRVIEAVIRNAL